jgi:hypothetical protein
MTITYNPNDGQIYAVQLEKILYAAPGPLGLSLVEMLEHLLTQLKTQALRQDDRLHFLAIKGDKFLALDPDPQDMEREMARLGMLIHQELLGGEK